MKIVIRDDPTVGFSCERTANGWSWTLTSRLGDLLRKAENDYGPRDQSYACLGIEFGGPHPSLWYPGNCKHIAIKLSDEARLRPELAYFQLAHEVIHLLSPEGSKSAPVIEEGLATFFSHQMSDAAGSSLVSAELSYILAEEALKKLLALSPNAIRNLRAHEPRFVRFTPAMILNEAPGLDPQVADYLCQAFVRQ